MVFLLLITESKDSKRNFNPEEQTVKITTIDSSKGLDFQAVLLLKQISCH